jgi:cytoskeleton protein RodZ
MDVGQELRVARERQGVTLQQLSAATKISPRVLQAIEAADEARLPARVFTRSFVKSYAEEVGLDPAATVALYMAQFEPQEEAEADAPQHAAVAPQTTPLAFTFGSNVPTPLVLTVVVALIVGITAWQRHGRHLAAPSAQPAAQAVAGITPAPAPPEVPVGTSGSVDAPSGGPLKFAVSASGPCWLKATVGDQQAFAGLLNTGEKRTFDVASDVTLRVGDPATFAYTINGKPGRAVGPPQQAVTVHITRENYQQYLAR